MKKLNKRIISAATAFFMSASTFSGLPSGVLTASAAAVYDIKICNIQVDSSNCNDILGNGIFTYVPSTQTLNINGDYGDYNEELINSSIDGLTVNVIEDSELYGYFYFYDNTTITGDGKLSLKTNDTFYAICVYNDASLSVTDADLDISGGYAIAGYNSGSKGLYVTNSSITAHGNSAAVKDFEYVSLNDCILKEPVYGVYGGGGIFENDMETYAKDVRIIPAYSLWVDRKQVTADNRTDILGNGVFTYDPAKKLLSITGSYDHDDDKELIYSNISNLTIDVVNDCEIPGYIELHDDTTITGKGILGVGPKLDSGITGILNDHCKLTFDNANVFAVGDTAIGSPTGTIEVRQSDILAVGKKQSFSFAENGFTLSESIIKSPDPYTIGTDTIFDDKSRAANIVTIGKDVKYDLMIGDVQVTSQNCEDILGDGTLKYDDDTKTLSIYGDINKSIRNSGIEDLTIDVRNDAKITSSDDCIFIGKLTTITGSGKLTLDSYDCGIYVYNNAGLYIEDATIDAKGMYGISGPNTIGYEHLSIKNSNITADCSTFAIGDFYMITLNGCMISEPTGGIIDGSYIYEPNGKTKAKKVTIEAVESYELYIAYTEVNVINCSDILGNGVFSYDNKTRTLTINGDYTSDPTNPTIISNIDGLTIVAADDSKLNGFFSLYGDTKITGSGRLEITGDDTYYILNIYNSKTLTIEDANISINGGHAIAGSSIEPNEKLVIKNSSVETRTTDYSVSSFTDIVLEDSFIVAPEDAVITSSAIYEADGITPAKNVKISPCIEYDLSIKNKSVTSLNCDDILGDGVFSYDDSTKTLTVNGDCIYDPNNEIIDSEIEGLTINIAKDSTMTGFIDLIKNTTITGKGKLTISCSDTYVAIYAADKLTIKDANLDVYGGIAIGTDLAEIEVIDSDIRAESKNYAFKFADTKFSHTQCNIIKPESYEINGGTICFDDGVTAAKKVVIEGMHIEYVPEKPATCTEDGVKAYCIKEETGEKFEDEECTKPITDESSLVIPKTGHKWGEWIVTKEATDTEEGEREHICSECGEKETEVIPCLSALPRGDVNGDGTVNVTDLSLTAAQVKGKKSLKEDQAARADVNGDDMITVTDVSLIAAHIKGKKALV